MALTFRYYGHSCFTVDADGTKLVIDPFFAPHNPACPVGCDEIPADFILVSHGHGDHIAHGPSIAKRTGATVIGIVEVVDWLMGQGAQQGHGMNLGGAYTFPFGRVKLTIAHHSNVLPDGTPGGTPVGFLIQFNDGHDVYFAGDTALTYDMRLIGEAGGVDLALLPIGDNFTMGLDDAIRAAQFVQAKHVIPMHFNTFGVIEQEGNAFAEKLRRTTEIDCTVLQPGDEFTL